MKEKIKLNVGDFIFCENGKKVIEITQEYYDKSPKAMFLQDRERYATEREIDKFKIKTRPKQKSRKNGNKIFRN